ncbi:arf-GAP with dual PH domain-containing protein 1-like isoform X2 [Macrosteles quadrilineatus]|uniref:arf-GAP with dual PH domain-containing protein 1-like isoform X2 n=1 Tax=Macrosteles quadrilineatus TaxID=74068 RepID=UPI0023E2139F|nr:arf-GAP with dual PH domain-containing protein 1-like isoform X2 [Macrosteles quadrilineatus]
MDHNTNGRAILELLKRPGNDICADCNCKKPEWASYNVGIFICKRCSRIHQGLGAHISKVKHVKLEIWEDSEIERMREVGNNVAKMKYESRVPAWYRRPFDGDPQPLLEDWICAKYQRGEFMSNDQRPSYMCGNLEGYLMKKGKEDDACRPRKFVLEDDTLRYYVKENKEPKVVIRLGDLNVSFISDRWSERNGLQLILLRTGLQLTYLRDGTTRHIFIYHDDLQTIIHWYQAIRYFKLQQLQVAFPGAHEDDLVGLLTQDFIKEGWLWKTGPRITDSYRKRWFTLDGRKLMYHEDKLDAHPKGEIFLGHMLDGYSVRVGVQPGARDQGFSFTLRTPERWYNLSANTAPDRDSWISAIESVTARPLSVHDKTCS